MRGLGRVTDTADIASVVVATRGSTPVHVRDIGRVTLTTQPRFGAVTRDGKGEALSAVVIMLKGSNGREVVQRVTDRLGEIRPLLPKGVRIRPFYNQGEVVERTTRTVYRNLVEGALLVIVILFLFLRNVRASLLTASVIPLSLLIAFFAMRRFGLSANLMSLGALDFGLIVDASVVMIENCVRRLRQADDGVDVRAAIRVAASEVGRPIVFGVGIIVAVYIPIFTLEGIEGRMFRPMAFTVCAAVLGSLALALTYVPAMASLVLKSETVAPDDGSDDAHDGGWFVRLRRAYRRWLGRALSSPRRTVGAAIALFATSLAVVPLLGTEFMPKLDEGYMLIESNRIPSIALAQGMTVSGEIERTLKQFPEVANVVTNLGRPQEATETMALNQGDVYVTFKPKSAWRARSLQTLIPQMDSALAQIPGLDYDFSAPMAMRLDEVVSGVKTELGIKIYGDSLPLLQETAEQIKGVVAGVRGAEDVSIGVSAGAMQLEVALDRPTIARYGLNVADVREAVETGIGGMAATEVVDGRRRIPVVVRLEDAYRRTPEAVASTLVNTPGGGMVALSQIARVNTVEGPEVVNHENGLRYVVVQSNVRGRDLGGFVADVRRAVGRDVSLPAGILRHLRRPIRKPSTGNEASRPDRPARAARHRRTAIRELRNDPSYPHRDHRGSTRAGRWDRRTVGARHPSQLERVGRIHRRRWSRRVERPRDGRVHQSAERGRLLVGKRSEGRCGRAPPSGADDGVGRIGRIHPDGGIDELRRRGTAAARDGRHRRAGVRHVVDAARAADDLPLGGAPPRRPDECPIHSPFGASSGADLMAEADGLARLGVTNSREPVMRQCTSHQCEMLPRPLVR